MKIYIMILNFQITFFDIVEQWQMGFQDSATPVMEGIITFHNDLMYFLIIIVIFVVWILFRIIFLFDEKKIQFLKILYMELQ